jgi:cation diffusion facilitator CzcD-associated flavoprotein CzcO
VADALFHTGVTRAEWDEDAARWRIHTDRGDEVSCRWYVLAVGILNLMKLPTIPGMEDFAGRSFHTAGGTTSTPAAGHTTPLTKLADKVVALIGTGASGIQCVPPLAESAKHLYVFQRTPSAIGERGNRPTDPDFARARAGLAAGPNGQLPGDHAGPARRGRPGGRRVDAPLRRRPAPAATQGHDDLAEYLRSAEGARLPDHGAHRRRVEELVADPATAEILKPYYRYLCKRPCFHDEYLQAFNNPNVTLIDCPAGIERITEQGPVVDGKQYEVDCIIYGTGFEAELTPLFRRAGHEIVGRGGVTLAEKWADGAASLFGMMSRGFPNMFVMPAPGQQAVVTVNYTQLAVLGAEFIGGAVGLLERAGRGSVRRERRGRGGVDAEDRRLLRRRQRRHVRLHAVAHQQRGPPRSDESPQRQLRPRHGRLVRLPRAARAVARGRQFRGPGTRRSGRRHRERVSGSPS